MEKEMINKTTICLSMISIFFVTVFVLKAEEFVIEKKKKEPKCSRSKLQEQCCQEFAEQLKECSRLLKEVGEVQELLLNQTIAYIEGDGLALINSADKNGLTVCLQEAKKCSQSLANVKTELQSYKKHITPAKK